MHIIGTDRCASGSSSTEDETLRCSSRIGMHKKILSLKLVLARDSSVLSAKVQHLCRQKLITCGNIKGKETTVVDNTQIPILKRYSAISLC